MYSILKVKWYCLHCLIYFVQSPLCCCQRPWWLFECITRSQSQCFHQRYCRWETVIWQRFPDFYIIPYPGHTATEIKYRLCLDPVELLFYSAW